MFPLADTPPAFFAVVHALAAAIMLAVLASLIIRHRWWFAVGGVLIASFFSLMSWLGYSELPPGPRLSAALVFSTYILLVVSLGLLGHGSFLRKAGKQGLSQDDPRVRRRSWVAVLQMSAAAVLIALAAGHWDLVPGFHIPG